MAGRIQHQLPCYYWKRRNRRGLQPAGTVAGENHSSRSLRGIRMGHRRRYSGDHHPEHLAHHDLGRESAEEAAGGHGLEGCPKLPAVVEEDSDSRRRYDARQPCAL